MELVVNQNLEFVTKPITVSQIKTEGLLTSNYKAIVKQNFNRPSTTTVFGIRQRVKSLQFSSVNHTAVVLKLSLFGAFLIALF